MDLEIVAARNDAATVDQLAGLLVETVASGGSVSFMHPLDPDIARGFWRDSLAAADAGGRIVLGARAAGGLVGTVTLLLAMPQNQPHRAEIAKLMTSLPARGRGVARTLVREAERRAASCGRTLITLDTAAEEGAGGFYERLGYERAGAIPDYAQKPHGGLCATLIYFKRLAPAAA